MKTNDQQVQAAQFTGGGYKLSASAPLEISRRFAWICLFVVLLIAAGLLAKQIACSRIATLDACQYYMPLAKAYAEGNLAESQHLMIPPLYPILVGAVSKLCGAAECPQETAGRLVSALCALLLIWFIYWIGAKGWNRRVGLAAAALTAVNHDVIFYGANVGLEMMYAAMLALAVLGLVCYIARPSLAVAMLIAISLALAALTRSEGIFMPAMAAAIMIAGVIIRRPAKRWRVAVHMLVFACVIAAIWWPRISYIHDATATETHSGYYVMDVRLIKRLPGGGNVRDFSGDPMPAQIARIKLPALPRHFGTNFNEVQSSLFMGFGPATWILALCWFIFRRNIPRQSLLQMTIFLIIVLEIYLVSQVKLGNRYLVTVSGLAQIWGGLGLVAFAEFMRSPAGSLAAQSRRRINIIGDSMMCQLAMLGLLMAGMACWSLFSENNGSRRAELRDFARTILRESGAGQVILTSSGSIEPVFYASGKLVLLDRGDDTAQIMTQDQMAAICRQHDVRYIVVKSKEKWLPPEVLQIPGIVVKSVETGDDEESSATSPRSYLLDAVKVTQLRD